MRLDGVGRQTNQFDSALGELRLELCECAELRCAYRSVILRMREENDPIVTNELMEVDGAFGTLSLEVRCS